MTDVRAVAVVVAAMLTQRWRLRPAHGACRFAQPVAEAVALLQDIKGEPSRYRYKIQDFHVFLDSGSPLPPKRPEF